MRGGTNENLCYLETFLGLKSVKKWQLENQERLDMKHVVRAAFPGFSKRFDGRETRNFACSIQYPNEVIMPKKIQVFD
jgi:hypothetical protein